MAFRRMALIAVLGLCGVVGAADQDADKKKVTGRLPANYAKLGMTEPQKEKIYLVQDKYRDQIEELEQRIVELKTKRDAEIGKLLTPAQRARLKELEDGKKPSDK